MIITDVDVTLSLQAGERKSINKFDAHHIKTRIPRQLFIRLTRRFLGQCQIYSIIGF